MHLVTISIFSTFRLEIFSNAGSSIDTSFLSLELSEVTVLPKVLTPDNIFPDSCQSFFALCHFIPKRMSHISSICYGSTPLSVQISAVVNIATIIPLSKSAHKIQWLKIPFILFCVFVGQLGLG